MGAVARRAGWALLIAFSVLVAIKTSAAAKAKPFWHDEIFTILVSELPLQTIPAALADGIDLQPRLNTLLTKLVHHVAGAGPVKTRLVPLTAFLVSLFVFFRIVRGRSDTATALLGVVFLCFTAAYRYSYEARGYSLMLMFAVAALSFWLEAAAGRHRRVNIPMLAITLAAGMWTHYFFAVVFLPIIAGELTRFLPRRRLDWPIAAAILAGGLASLLMLPVARVAVNQSSTFWARASMKDVWPTYEFLLNRSIDGAIAVAVVLGIVLAAVIRYGAKSESRLTAHETVAFLIFLILPALSVTLGVVIGVFSDHYALPGVIGLAVGPPILLWRIGQRRTIAVLPVLLLLLYRFGSGPLILPMNVVSPSPAADRVLLKQALADRSAPPVAVTGGLMFLQLWYYLPADLRSQMIFLASPDQAAKYGRPDTIDRGLQALSRWTSLRTEEYHAFVQNHRSVRVYTAGSGWLLKALEDDGATLRIENRELGAVLYTAEMKSP